MVSFGVSAINGIVPNTPAWYAWRRDGVGGSDVPLILEAMPDGYAGPTPRQLAALKLGIGPEPEAGNYAMRRGQLLEPRARAQFCARKPWLQVRAGCCENNARPHHRASLDCWWKHPAPQIAELKCPKHEWHRLFAAVERGEQSLSALPQYMLIQVQWQLYVTGAELCWLGSYSEKKGEAEPFHLVKVLPERILWEGWLVPAVESWWARVQQAKDLFARRSRDARVEFEDAFDELFPPPEPEPESGDPHPDDPEVATGAPQ